jgi:hypothetical protein
LDRQTVAVPISELKPGDSPRLDGMDAEHTRALAEMDMELPPILVHRSTMRVIDGMHRVDAALMAGRASIGVRFFEGSEDEAFLVAVRANIAHGLPLTLADRRAAAERIVRSRPELSDRSIASIAGLSAKTVAVIRRQATGADQQLDVRIGRDGRSRPLNSTLGRRIAAEIVMAHPEASLRKIAKEAGISVGTARDVRERVHSGEDPTSTRQRPIHKRKNPGMALRADGNLRGVDDGPDSQLMLERLRRDPSLRYTEAGRAVLLWLSPRVIVSSEWKQLCDKIPPHCAIIMARIARGCATAWAEFAEELDRRNPDLA